MKSQPNIKIDMKQKIRLESNKLRLMEFDDHAREKRCCVMQEPYHCAWRTGHDLGG